MIYPIYRFIQDDLKMTVYRFSKESSIKQRTISTWKQRNRAIADLPIFILDEFAHLSCLSLSDIRDKLTIYELEFLSENMLSEEGKTILLNHFVEAGEQFGRELKQNQAEESLKLLNYYRPKEEDPSIEQFLAQYLKICQAYQLPTFSEFTTIGNDMEQSILILQFLIAAWHAAFD